VKLYKYRELSDPDEVGYDRLAGTLKNQTFWAARPDSLNDPEEFFWSCDYSPSPDTASLLAQVLVANRRLSDHEASHAAALAVSSGRVAHHAEPVIQSVIQRCRAEVGLICFGDRADNECLWQRYAGGGAGVCIELEVPAKLLNREVHAVRYPAVKSLHIDRMLECSLPQFSAEAIYGVALLSKPPHWAPEQELRYVCKRQDIPVSFDNSKISALVLGGSLSDDLRARIESLATELPYKLNLLDRDA
jgi:hypothetical protein